jgi:hypothetical protein
MKYAAIYNATRKELVVANEKRLRDMLTFGAGAMGDEIATGSVFYTLTDFDYVDSVALASYTAEDFVRAGWVLVAA